MEMGIDFINTDHIVELTEYLNKTDFREITRNTREYISHYAYTCPAPFS